MSRPHAFILTFGLFLLSVWGMIQFLNSDLLFVFCWLCALLNSFLSFRLGQIRCPHCRRTIHQYWQQFSHCPYCGRDLEEKP